MCAFKSKNVNISTRCMSSFDDENLIEVFVFSNIQDELRIELLTLVAFYHKKNKLGLNQLISLRYLDGPDHQKQHNSRNENFYWPVTNQEVDFKRNHGIEELESKVDSTE